MDSSVQITHNIPPIWHIVERIREDVGQSLSAYPEDIRHACMMTASELMENAVKYSSQARDNGGIQFEMTADDRRVRIALTSSPGQNLDIEELQARIEEIYATPDLKSLYVLQLTRLMDGPSEKTGLGLYRIAYEGGFSLRCDLKDDSLTIEAVRNIQTDGV